MFDMETTHPDGMRSDGEAREVGDALVRARDDADDPAGRWEKADIKARLFGAAAPQRSIGRYTVSQRLGVGGMGEVLAGHDPTLDRPVAIKLLHPALEGDTREHRARMIREAKTLAKLRHPNVVQIYEVGEAEGRVFLAMELVQGQTLRRWQEQEHPHWSQVLARYLEAGRGLVAVHQAGLVHRDFKPDNVLLGEDGRVCVADFGLARHATGMPSMEPSSEGSFGLGVTPGTSGGVSEGGASATQLTRTGRVAGTPAYMAPEQLRAIPVDARADQFAFCVALYEGLYGRRPFGGRTLGALVASRAAGPSQPPRRSVVPRRVWRVLARGLAEQPEQRFGSMEALLRALDPGRARRRRMLVLGVGLGLPAVAAAAASMRTVDPCPRPDAAVLGFGSDVRARVVDRIEHGGPADGELVGRTVAEHLDGVVEALADAKQQVCEATHVDHVQSEALLDRRNLCLDDVGERMRGLVAVLLQADATAVDNAVEAATTLPRPERCSGPVAEYGTEPPRDAEQAAAVAEARAGLARARAWLELEHPTHAREQLEPWRDVVEALGYDPLTAELRHLQGLVAWRLGELERAAGRLGEAGELADGSRHDLLAAEVWSDRTALSYTKQSPRDAAGLLLHARAAVRRIGSPPELSTEIKHHESEVARVEGKLDRARELLLEVLAERRAQGDPLALARACTSLAKLYVWMGEPSLALPLHEEARHLYERQLGVNSLPRAAALYNVGATLVALGRQAEARAPLEAALAIWAGRGTEAHPDVVLAHLALHQVELGEGTLERALHHAQAARRSARARGLESPGDLASAEMAVGASLLYAGSFGESAQAYASAWEILREARGDEDPEVALARANLAEAVLGQGNLGLARTHAEAAHRTLQAALPGHPVGSLPLKVLGRIGLAEGHSSTAIEQLGRALGLLEGGGLDLALERFDAAWWLARAHHHAGDHERARQLARAARAALAEHQGELGRLRIAELEAWMQEVERSPLEPTKEQRK